MAKRSKVKLSVTHHNSPPADVVQKIVSRRRAAGVRSADLRRGLNGPWVSGRVVGGAVSPPDDDSPS